MEESIKNWFVHRPDRKSCPMCRTNWTDFNVYINGQMNEDIVVEPMDEDIVVESMNEPMNEYVVEPMNEPMDEPMNEPTNEYGEPIEIREPPPHDYPYPNEHYRFF